MSNIVRKSKVFISCGQAEGTTEREVARAIGEKLTSIGFEVYIAVQEQTLAGLKDNIFRQLESSDYFVFVDFAREKLAGTIKRRGSLFSHQELAIASYLGLPVIGFREQAVKKDDGIAQFIQGNFVPFRDRHFLADEIAQRVSERQWQTDCPNCLWMNRDPTQYTDADRCVGSGTKRARFFQIEVMNNHKTKIARDCFVYLERIRNTKTGEEIPTMSIEFKWEAFLFPSAIILPGTVRRFDAFFVYHELPNKLLFNPHTDYQGAFPVVPAAPGQFEFTYLVASDNFGTTRATFAVNLGNTLSETRLVNAD
jgi:hypothetical protein